MAANDTGWAAGDVQTAARRNVEWIIGRLTGGVHDFDTIGTVTAVAKPIDGALISSTIGDHYTVGSVAVTLVRSLTLFNSHSAAVAVTVHIVESGGSAGVSTTIFADSLEAGETVDIKVPYFLAPGDKIRAVAGTTAVVSLRGELLEIKTMPAGITLKVITAVALTTSYVAHYTQPGGGVRIAYLLATTTCNTHSAALVASINIVPTGGSPVKDNQIFGDSMQSKETVTLEPFSPLESGDTVQAKAATGALIGHRLTVLEVA